MKYSKFRKLQERHPFLGHDLYWRGCPRNHREFVRTKVGFIAFRPFESLDLKAKNSSSSTALNGKYPSVPKESYTAVEYQISFHVEGEDEVARLRYITSDVGDGSIEAHLADLRRWFDGCEAFVGKQLVWERVVKRTVSGSSFAGLTNMNLEIYLFPRHYGFRPIPRPRIPEPDPSTVAYVTRAPIPPIIPGMLCS